MLQAVDSRRVFTLKQSVTELNSILKDITLFIDKRRTVRAIGNIIQNAISATSRGGSIIVSVGVTSEPEKMLKISIADDGVGISKVL